MEVGVSVLRWLIRVGVGSLTIMGSSSDGSSGSYKDLSGDVPPIPRIKTAAGLTVSFPSAYRRRA